MDKKKEEIKNLVQILSQCNYCITNGCEECTEKKDCFEYVSANLLLEAGYGDIKKAVTEFADMLKKAIVNDREADRKACGKSAFKEGFYTVLLGLIDELVKEFCDKETK